MGWSAPVRARGLPPIAALMLALLAGCPSRERHDRPPAPPALPPPPSAPADPAHAGGAPAPIEVYADSEVGDWRAYRVTTESSLAPTVTAEVVAQITAVDAEHVTEAHAGRAVVDGTERTQHDQGQRPRAGLTIDQLTGNAAAGWTIFDLQITDDVHVVGGRRFRCKKLSYASIDPLFPGKRTRTELWITKEVPAGGLVEERELQELGDTRFVITQRLVAYGAARGRTWGERPAGL